LRYELEIALFENGYGLRLDEELSTPCRLPVVIFFLKNRAWLRLHVPGYFEAENEWDTNTMLIHTHAELISNRTHTIRR
jgi:hypothetical protein